MKIRTCSAACPVEYLEAYGLNPDKTIYFDIETTGFSPSSSSLYMIGWAVSRDDGSGRWSLVQVFAENKSQEKELLISLADELRCRTTLIAFNGDRFDLPYLRYKYAACGLEDPFSGMKCVDLYKEIRPYGHALNLNRLNQKSVEGLLNITRKDRYGGGELIDVYRSVRDGRLTDEGKMQEALDALFLHNCEDVLGMLRLTSLLAYPLAFSGDGPVLIEQEDPGACPEYESQRSCGTAPGFTASFDLKVPVPADISLSFDGVCCLSLSGLKAKISVCAISGTMYHFFPDYRNYYYLPEEDTAMHRSVASFVSPAHREAAKASNCYVKKNAVYLPMPDMPKGYIPYAGPDALDHLLRDDFRRYYKDPVRWFEYTNDLKEDSRLMSAYIHELVRRTGGIFPLQIRAHPAGSNVVSEK